jgi:hypothetical protein
MEKTELIINIRSLLDSIESSLKKECVNKIPDVEKFICIKIDDSFNPFLFRDLITSIPQETEEIMDYINFCNYVDSVQDLFSWVDICPFKVNDSYILYIVKLVVKWNKQQEIGFHGSFPSFRHYPIYGQKYDLNYFWQVSDKDYNIREKKWCNRCKKILRKYEIQKWFAKRVYKYFGKKLEIMNLDKEIRKINVLL